MKITITNYPKGSEVIITDNDNSTLHHYVFDDRKQAEAFFTGFRCAQQVINGLVQSLPLNYEVGNNQ